MTAPESHAAPSECEIELYVNHDVTPTSLSWKCSCGVEKHGFASRRDRDQAADRHLAEDGAA